jgi:hypothetical protein
MSITPVNSFPLDRSEPSANPNAGSGHAQAVSDAPQKTAVSVSTPAPSQENTVAKDVSSTYNLPQDVVELHQDPDIKGQIIIQYLDQSKDVVLQVPSAQELNVERGIAQEFQQAAKVRETADAIAAVSEGIKAHGD